MPKFKPKKPTPPFSKKKEKKEPAAMSPLMEDEDEPLTSSSSSSRGGLRGKRDAKKKAVSEKKESKKSSLSKKKESKKETRSEKKESMKEKRSEKKESARAKKSEKKQNIQDKKDSKMPCCARFAQFMAKTIHIIDLCLGLVFVIYGALIMTSFDTPAMEAAITCLAFGSLLMFTAIMGGIGLKSKACSRVGLVISAYTAPFIAFFYIVVVIALLADPDTLFNYLTEHKDVLFLNDGEIATLKSILPFFYIALACLAAIEILRFFGLRKIRDKLNRFDAASERSSSAKSSTSKSSSSRSKSSRSKSSESDLTEPLMGYDEEMGEESSSDEESD